MIDVFFITAIGCLALFVAYRLFWLFVQCYQLQHHAKHRRSFRNVGARLRERVARWVYRDML